MYNTRTGAEQRRFRDEQRLEWVHNLVRYRIWRCYVVLRMTKGALDSVYLGLDTNILDQKTVAYKEFSAMTPT